MTIARTLSAAILIALTASTGHAATPYDGSWNVTLTCPAASDGSNGYVYRFAAKVTEGVLHGEYGQRDSSGWLALDGPIQPNGHATLTAQGLTGNPAFSVGRVQQGSPVRYHVDAQFDPHHGTGTRIETRRCGLEFQRV